MMPPCPPPTVDEQVVTLGIEGWGHALGGTAVVSLDPVGWSLTLLAPGGLELYTASGPPPTVSTGLVDWKPWLERLPFERDLRLLYTLVPEGGCLIGEARLRVRANGRVRWRGAPGGAVAWRGSDGWHLRDRLRRYTLRLAIPRASDAP